MIVVFVNSMEDTATFSPLYDRIENCTLLYNPSREEVEKVLTENPNETLMCLGHGSARGLFTHDFKGYLIDRNTPYLDTREIIGVWCYASDFARINNLRGFFTYMFISNPQEALVHRCGEHTYEFVYEQNRQFATKLNELIRNETPMEDWVEILYEGCDLKVDFVEFNYSNLAYFNGEENYVPQLLLDEEKEFWEEGTLWRDVCYNEECEFIVCFTDNDGIQKWERVNSYEEMVNRVDELSVELYEENAKNIMVFGEDSQI